MYTGVPNNPKHIKIETGATKGEALVVVSVLTSIFRSLASLFDKHLRCQARKKIRKTRIHRLSEWLVASSGVTNHGEIVDQVFPTRQIRRGGQSLEFSRPFTTFFRFKSASSQ